MEECRDVGGVALPGNEGVWLEVSDDVGVVQHFSRSGVRKTDLGDAIEERGQITKAGRELCKQRE